MAAFQDHFSAQASAYARARPVYPEALYAWLADLAPGHALAIDVGCGNGQATQGLAAHFDAVLGTDASAEQIERCRAAAGVRFAVAPAHQCPVADGSADLLTAAQAAHWFDETSFHTEARRVLRPRGVLALWCYELLRVAPTIDALIDVFYRQTLGADWPPERRHVDAGYRTLAFPFGEFPEPSFELRHQWHVEALLAYLSTWSAYRRHLARTGADPLAALEPALRDAWGPGSRDVTWRLRVRAGRR